MPKVYNKYHGDAPIDAIYIGRPSKWGNPFVVGKDGERGECVMLYEDYLMSHPELIKAAQEELRGKSLVCWCAPRACHGDILMKVANA